jgi:hypothetical protein
VRGVLLVLIVFALAAIPAGAQVPDTTPPVVDCAADDGTWHPDNVSLACTASDPESGIPNPSDQAFNLTTSVPAGTETSTASTGSRNVCNGDPMPLCTQAGPISGIRIDRLEPLDPTRVRSTDHTVRRWSRDRTITIAFNAGADGGSGVDGFSRSWSRFASSQPDAVKDLEQGARRATSSRLRNGRWFFHLRTVDNVGNWTSTVHRGPYLIDGTKPRVRALSGSGKTNRWMRLRYRTADNNDRTREKLILSKGGSIVKRWTRAMGNARWWNVQGVDWRPRSAGSYRFCVRAWDRASNTRKDCAGINVKTPAPSGGPRCDPSYPSVCIPPPPPDLDCPQVRSTDFAVRPPDPHGFDGDGDGVGCET